MDLGFTAISTTQLQEVDRLWILAITLVVLLLIFFTLLVIARRQSVHRRHHFLHRDDSKSVDDEENDEGPLPENPADALMEMKRQHDQ